MPTYEYQCEKCAKTFEIFQSMKDEPLAVCPKECCQQETWGEGKVKRLLGTGAGLIFKGSGFYITDYRKGSGKGGSGEAKPASSDTKPASAEAKKPAAPSGDGKPAAPAPKKN